MPRPAKQETAQPRRPRITKRGENGQPGRSLQISEVRSRGFDTSKKGAAELVSPDKPLTDMQRSFIMHFAQGESVVSAMTRAGYGTDTGSNYGYRLLRQPNALALYNAEKKKYEEAAHMSRKKVMDGLLEAIEMAKLAGEPAAMVSGWREIGRMCGYYEPVTRKLDITINGAAVMDRMNRLSDQELLDLIQGGIAEAEEPLLLENGS